MKSLFITVLILGCAFLGYDYYLAPAHERVVFKQSPAPTPEPSKVVEAPVPPPTVAPVAPPSSPVETPAAVVASAPAVMVKETPAEAADGVPSIEAFTESWTKFPPSAFPRPVLLKKDVQFAMAGGSSTIAAGTEVVALSYNPAGLSLAPTPESKARSVVPMEVTDFKARMTVIYDAWKARKLAEAQKPAETRPVAASTLPHGAVVDSAGKPVIAPDGTIPVILAAMKAGKVSDVTPYNITHWGTPKLENIKGEQLWTVDVEYKASTQLGAYDAETVAHIRDGKVHAWVFKGTGEPVP